MATTVAGANTIMTTNTSRQPILIIGLGELGSAIIAALLTHPAYSKDNTPLSVLIRPSTLSNPTPSKSQYHTALRSQPVTLIPSDLNTATEPELTTLFQEHNFRTIIHATGMTRASGTMLKLTRAVLAAKVPLYIPWQFGVDYDVITRRGGQGMFSEQIDVRDLLRSRADNPATNWVIVSNGMFMSFLFEEFWGVVVRQGGKVKVTALSSWHDTLTLTTAEDIGVCTAEIVFASPNERPTDQAVYIAGDTVTYASLADVLEKVSGKEVVRDVWPLEHLREESSKDPEDLIKRYRVVFAEGKGVSWPMEGTWSARKAMKMEGVEEWVRKNFM